MDSLNQVIEREHADTVKRLMECHMEYDRRQADDPKLIELVILNTYYTQKLALIMRVMEKVEALA